MKNKFLLTAFFLSFSTGAFAHIEFLGHTEKLKAIESSWAQLLAHFDVDSSLVLESGDAETGKITFQLSTPSSETTTLDFSSRASFGISPENYVFVDYEGNQEETAIVSQKEILLAMLQHGRTFRFGGNGDPLEALQDVIGIRQNVARWTVRMNRPFPDEVKIKSGFNPAYWNDWFILKPGVPADVAMADVFTNPAPLYAMGCTSRTKLTLAQAAFDYYANVKHDSAGLARATALVGDKPLTSLGLDYDDNGKVISSGLLSSQNDVPADNWIAGDWAYFRNNDPKSRQISGWEGSNTLYQGEGVFGNYYPDTLKKRLTLEDKVNEVESWQFGVEYFQTDPRATHYSGAAMMKLLVSPLQGGILWPARTSVTVEGAL